ncbi:MAG: gliding motility-associated C-terminal domain-containing protein [Flavobacteriales bacterium]|nr:gliding motility-associated C-terminal domain-containing protein [Flavobacteriales bacterium]
MKKIYLMLVIYNVIGMSLDVRAQGACGSPDGTFYDNNGTLGTSVSMPADIGVAVNAGKCYKFAQNQLPRTVCYTYRYPTSGTVQFRWLTDNRPCNGSCTYGGSSTTNSTFGCNNLGGPTCGTTNINTYDESCNLVGPGFPIGTGCGSGMFPGQIYTVCMTLNPTGCTDSIVICPILNCSGGSCGCVLAASTSSTDVTCKGGSNGTATVTATGGSNPKYTWSNGKTTATVTGLSAGTHSVTVTSNSGICSDVQTVTVSEPATNLTVSASHTDVNCKGGSDGTGTVNPSGGTPGYTYLWANGQTTATATGLTAGNHQVTVTDANSCTGPGTVTVTVDEPVANLTVSDSHTDVNCKGGNDGTGTVSPSGGTPGYTYLWANGQTTATATGLVAGNHQVTITDANGCTGPGTVTVTVNEPNADLTAATNVTNALCKGASDGTATVNPAGGTPTYTYLWNNGQTTQTATGLSAGTYQVTVTDANGCTNVSVVSATVGEPTVLALAGSEIQSTCGNSNGSAIVTPSGGTPGYTYLWGNGQTGDTAVGLLAGNYNVTVTDNNGCQKNIQVSVNDQNGPSATASSTNVLCFGSNEGTGTVVPSGGTPPLTFAWSDGQTTATATGLVMGTYGVTVFDVNGCLATQSITVTEPTVLSSSATSSTNVSCKSGNDGTGTVTPAGGTPNYSFEWSDGQTTATATGFPAGTFSVTISDANGCTYLDSVTITQPIEPLDLNSVANNISCYGGFDGSITAGAVGGTPGYTYEWSDGQTGATATGLMIGGYTVTVTDANGCTNSGTFTLIEPTALTLNMDSSNALCGIGSGTATAYPGGGTPGYTYEWDDGQTTSLATGLYAGNYTVTITDANGCTIVNTTTVLQTPSVTGITSSTGALCNGSNDGTATVMPSGGSTPYSYLWSDGQTGIIATGLVAGNYILTVTDSTGCDTVLTVSVGQPTPLVSSTSGDQFACENANVIISATATGGIGPYTYQWDDPGSGTTPDITVIPPVTTVYSVTVTDANGCIQTDNVTITTNTQPEADFDVIWVPSCDGLRGKFTDVSINGTSVLWDFGDGYKSPELMPIHEFPYGTISQVVLTVTNGTCTDTAMVTADIQNFDFYNDPQVPNVFSPNGDGINEQFKVFVNGEMAECTKLTILNRWGNFIYSPPGGQLAWDGRTTAGEVVPEGTYFYVVDINGHQKAGSVTVIKK